MFLDDDVILEPNCIENMTGVITSAEDIVGVVSDFNNQLWPNPTTAWRWYLHAFHGVYDGQWNGRVVGPYIAFWV